MWFSIVLWTYWFLLDVNAQALGGPCTTPSGESATCIQIFECEPLMKLIRSPGRTRKQTKFIEDSQCGVNPAGVTYVCCGSGIKTNGGGGDYTPNPSIPNRNECGLQTQDKIFNGESTSLDEFPWMVVIENELNGTRRISCGGSLINNRYILTAAHCAIEGKLGSPVNVRLGEYNTSSKGVDCFQKNGVLACNQPEVNAGIEEIISHPDYSNKSKMQHDIALIRLDKDIGYSDFIQPICLPLPTEASRVGERLIVAGWGKTEEGKNSDVKMKLQIPIKNISDCRNAYSRFPVEINDNQLCAGGEYLKDSCTGDSGSPLMKKITSDESRWMIEGFVSFGYFFCGTREYPGVYTRIAKYLPWIHSTVKPS